MHTAPRILVASVSAVLLVGSAWSSAYAGQNLHKDPAKDVYSQTDAGVNTVLPKRAEADITRVKVTYDGHVIHGTVHFRKLSKKLRHHYVTVRDSHGGSTQALDVFTWKGNPQGRDDGDCMAGTFWHFNYATRVWTFTLTDQCVPASGWVRLQITSYMSTSDSIAYLDDAYRKGAPTTPVPSAYGPKVFAS